MDIKEIALKIADSLRNKIDGISHMQSNQGLVAFAEALIAELAKQNEPVAINEPNYHYEAMGCGLEDRGITDRYEAMEYGWNCAIERMFEQLPEDPLFTFPPTAEQIANETAEACAKFVSSRSEVGDYSLYAINIRSGAWKEFKK